MNLQSLMEQNYKEVQPWRNDINALDVQIKEAMS